MFDFNPLKKMLSDASGQIRARQVELEKLQRQREDVAAAPASREDAIKALHGRIDAEADKHLRIVAGALLPLIVKGDPSRIDSPILAAVKSGSAPSPLSLEAGLCLAMGEQMKAAASRIIDGMEWPLGAIDHADKEKKVSELDRKISEIESELSELVHSARAAGVSF